MKLKELAIDGFGARRNLQLGRFGDGLSLVYGENGAGKTTIREFVRGTLFDFERHEQITNTPPFSTGRLNVTFGTDEFQLSRDVQLNSEIDVRSLNGDVSNRTSSLQQIAGNLNTELYDTAFNVSFQKTPTNAIKMASVLKNQLGVPCGPEAAGDEAAFQNWQRESKTRRERLEALQLRIDGLTRERNGLESQISMARSGHQNQASTLEHQINQVVARINEVQGSTYHDRLGQLDHEIAQLRLLIENANSQVSYVAPQAATVGQESSLYQRLDEIDNQIRRWRHVQSDIQEQRVRLRDEMLVWNELTLDSHEHPYHNARAILVALESKVDEAERNANHWGDAGASRVDTSQMARTLGQLCQSMRDDLYGLCNELAHQYKHLRHKAAAGELKQLRRCYSEMGENIQRLIQRRESAIRDLREIDPAGADAVIRSDLKFCECAQHAGYLEARRQFIGEFAAPNRPTANVVEPNLHAERARLVTLEQQRTELAATIVQMEQEHGQLKAQHANLVVQRDRLLSEQTPFELNSKIQAIVGELQSLTSESTILAQQVEKDRTFMAVEPNLILQRAGGLLTRMSNGDLTQVFLGEPIASIQVENQTEIQVRDRIGKVLNFSAIDAGLQDQTYLCLMLAIKEQMIKSGIETPTLVDDAFCRIPGDRVTPTLNVMNEVAALGHQIIALTQHRYLADRVPGLPLLELSPVDAAPPVHAENPVRTAPVAQVTLPSQPTNEWTPNAFTHEAYVNSELPRPYPLSKYPRTKSDVSAEDRDYTVAYPLSNVGLQTGTNDLEPARFNSQSANSEVNYQNVSAVSVDAIGDRLGYASGISEATRLDKVGFFESNQLRTFYSNGIESVADLLRLDWKSGQTLGFHPDQVDRWQAQLWLLINLPGIRLTDARILVACGVTEPEQLDTSHPQQILERIERFFATSEGRRFAGNQEPISIERINGWYRSLDATRSRWQSGPRSNSRRQEYSRDRQSTRSERDPDYRDQRQRPSHERTQTERQPRERTHARAYQPRDRDERDNRSDRQSQYRDREPRQYRERPDRESRPDREPRVARPPRMNTSRPERKIAPRVAPNTKLAEKSTSKSASKPRSTTKKLKFYLDLNDHIEAAPSIGPKMAERFEKIGVQSVADFLKQTAESMATKIKYKRMSADLIRQWQHQARLVCRIPNLRGHDAQLLVACDVTEPEELSTMQPTSLFEIIGPFSESKEGLKIIRNGKQPDLAEITDWISWAEQTRSIQAA